MRFACDHKLAIVKQGLAYSHIHLPGHLDVERRAVTVRRRIDLPMDGLSNVGKRAIRRLTLLRVTGDVLLASTANTINWMLDAQSWMVEPTVQY